MLPDIETRTFLGKEYTFTTTGGVYRDFMGDGCANEGRILGFLMPCWSSANPNAGHVIVKVYRRRIQDWFFKTEWYMCPKCFGSWPV